MYFDWLIRLSVGTLLCEALLNCIHIIIEYTLSKRKPQNVANEQSIKFNCVKYEIIRWNESEEDENSENHTCENYRGNVLILTPRTKPNKYS